MDRLLKPWQLSLLIHLSFLGLFFFITVLKISTPTEIYEVPIEVSAPEEAQNLKEVKEQPKVVLKSINQPVPDNKPVREVFGASRKTYTDSSATDGVEIKKGNTLAKEVDTLKLEDTDADSLPTPTEEYLVSDMPVLISEVRPVYPREAKEKQLEGAVSLDVLIDDKGNVRQVSVIEGPEIFKTGAVEAMKKFKFRPAKVEGKPVAVRIRYSIKFKLEF